MSHLDPDELALLAMGEPARSADESEHLEACPACARALAEFVHAVDLGRASLAVGELEIPASAVWDRIAEELELGASDPRSEAEAGAVLAETSPALRERTRSRRTARGRTRAVWMLAAALVLVAGAGLGGWMLAQRAALTPVAEAALAPFPDHPGAEGSALVEKKGDGEQFVRVTLAASSAPDTYREVWLITADASALISLGVLDGDEGTFSIPSGVDLRDYVLVDVSQEAIDGDPNHSGDSIVRGELSFDGPAQALP
ncbi:anti-sigma factor [Microbacterium sp. P02]|uniref:anti-sigma factor n=1 Tax=Microbacterium sp. P02 TaxID=3366260 RepID=UPI00367147B3